MGQLSAQPHRSLRGCRKRRRTSPHWLKSLRCCLTSQVATPWFAIVSWQPLPPRERELSEVARNLAGGAEVCFAIGIASGALLLVASTCCMKGRFGSDSEPTGQHIGCTGIGS